ncbi:cytochrome c oxidase subunit 4 [Salsuginibacillus halophilus]|uniref:Cytochrome c oxidase subunit 4 n=1 Tax=Salsuginibacillus halophilus TaxID=517424 RepID=A0A2P8HXB1_9BACI|nr:cytochrome C oxidase subunit IV family protein [Salsuginibacillus halophilus]PSL50824.1 cytochrome c oxidase subunit 4 [Salsuginibacillus halophilus]
MGENLSQPFEKSAMSKDERIQLEREKRIQITAFAFMISLTLLAFIATGSEIIPAVFTVPFIVGLAVIQFFLQLFYFMHLKDKNHAWPNMMMVSGVFLSTPTIIALALLLGETKF